MVRCFDFFCVSFVVVSFSFPIQPLFTDAHIWFLVLFVCDTVETQRMVLGSTASGVSLLQSIAGLLSRTSTAHEQKTTPIVQLQTACVRITANLVAENAENRSLVCNTSVDSKALLTLVVEAIPKHIDANAQLSKVCCVALANAVCDSVECQSIAVAAGAIETVTRVFRETKLDELEYIALYALSNLTDGSTSTISKHICAAEFVRAALTRVASMDDESIETVVELCRCVNPRDDAVALSEQGLVPLLLGVAEGSYGESIPNDVKRSTIELLSNVIMFGVVPAGASGALISTVNLLIEWLQHPALNSIHHVISAALLALTTSDKAPVSEACSDAVLARGLGRLASIISALPCGDSGAIDDVAAGIGSDEKTPTVTDTTSMVDSFRKCSKNQQLLVRNSLQIIMSIATSDAQSGRVFVCDPIVPALLQHIDIRDVPDESLGFVPTSWQHAALGGLRQVLVSRRLRDRLLQTTDVVANITAFSAQVTIAFRKEINSDSKAGTADAPLVLDASGKSPEKQRRLAFETLLQLAWSCLRFCITDWNASHPPADWQITISNLLLACQNCCSESRALRYEAARTLATLVLICPTNHWAGSSNSDVDINADPDSPLAQVVSELIFLLQSDHSVLHDEAIQACNHLVEVVPTHLCHVLGSSAQIAGCDLVGAVRAVQRDNDAAQSALIDELVSKLSF
jgi:hypothetical protein